MYDINDINDIKGSFKNTLLVGEVVENKDPDKRGRVQVFIKPIHQDLKIFTTSEGYSLPWAVPLNAGFGGGKGTKDNPDTNNWGITAVPRIGDTIVMMAIMDNLSTLCYFGCLRSKYQILPETPDTAGSVDPSTYEIRFHNGHRLAVRTAAADSEIKIESSKGYFITINDITDTIQISVGNATATMVSNNNITLNIGPSKIVMGNDGIIHLN